MKRRVLVVEDLDSSRVLLARVLELLSLQVDTAASYPEAVRQLAATEYGLVITDLRLDGGVAHEGLGLLAEVKRAQPAAQVIVLTGWGDPATMERAFELGAACYFEKPVSIHELRDAVGRLVR